MELYASLVYHLPIQKYNIFSNSVGWRMDEKRVQSHDQEKAARPCFGLYLSVFFCPRHRGDGLLTQRRENARANQADRG